ncbi:hypothetical protein [Methylopila sp. Yamaguchi]|uniref:hypothetical protein n=1 Tax=Methylopila sp. Yamaguchi TaxID=1437817 RepID=UPI000CAACC2C|nr:hypothetical protein [Methylopila sp. Yamaguchi]GBD49853.1 hypothetical protein METY_3066 [Methylopila sp. Yamaguchi]
MSRRTQESTVTFLRPFTLKALDNPQPAGTYRLVVDEDEILGVSILAYRRVATMLQTPALAVRVGAVQFHLVDPADLTAALDADRAALDEP